MKAVRFVGRPDNDHVCRRALGQFLERGRIHSKPSEACGLCHYRSTRRADDDGGEEKVKENK
jgi:hypothetical protein